MIAVVHHPDYVAASPPGSRYSWNKNGLVRDLLHAMGERIDWHRPPVMPREWIEAVHDVDYVAEVAEARVPPEKERRIGFAISPAVSRRSFLVPGGTYLAARLAMERGFAANTAGGSHHALATPARAIACSTIWRSPLSGWRKRGGACWWSIAMCIRATALPR